MSTASSGIHAADDPDEIAHPGERTVTSWTRCTHVTDPLATARTSGLTGAAR